jgi:hypothetical protein
MRLLCGNYAGMKTPGQLAYETFATSPIHAQWDGLPDELQQRWHGVARAARSAPEPKPEPKRKALLRVTYAALEHMLRLKPGIKITAANGTEFAPGFTVYLEGPGLEFPVPEGHILPTVNPMDVCLCLQERDSYGGTILDVPR